MTKDEMIGLWAKVVDENQRKSACRLHQFDAPEKHRMGAWYACRNCGGTFRLMDIGLYAQGYAAAGGDANTIFAGLGATEGHLAACPQNGAAP